MCDMVCGLAVVWCREERLGSGPELAQDRNQSHIVRLQTTVIMSAPGTSSPVTLSELPAGPLVYSPHILFSHRHRGGPVMGLEQRQV